MKSIPTLAILLLIAQTTAWAQAPAPAPATPAPPPVVAPATESDAAPAEELIITQSDDASVDKASASAGEAPDADEEILDLSDTDSSLEISLDDANEGLVSLNFEDATLSEIIKSFQKTVKVNIITGDGEELKKKVSVKLNRVPWQSALTSILNDRGFKLTQTDEAFDIYTVSPKREEIISQTFELNNASVKDVVNFLNGVTEADAKNPQAAASKKAPIAKGFPASSTVVVKGTTKELDAIAKLIKVIDKPATQVYIDARFVRLTASASKQLGMKWNTLMNQSLSLSASAGMSRHQGATITNDGVGTVFPNAAGDITATASDVGNISYKGVTGTLNYSGLQLALSAFEQMDGASTFSNPKIIVSNETLATIDMTTKSPAVKVKVLEGEETTSRTSIETELMVIPGKDEPWVGESYFSYGIELSVLPRICPDGTIAVTINPSISSKIGDYEVASSSVADQNAVYSRYPIIKMQRLSTEFTMESGATAVIGGLTETYENNVESGIPLLREIPWVGPRLFGWKGREKTQDEIIILVTVGIVPSNKDAIGKLTMPVHSARTGALIDSLKDASVIQTPEISNLKQ